MVNPAKANLYDSYMMYHSDGALLCTCSKTKAEWYIDQGLAVWYNPEKTAFKLNFEPNGRARSNDPYYTQKMKNQCVCCGGKEQLSRHHVVPYVFRQRFPVKYKAKSHYDILALCIECHENYEHRANELKKKLRKDFGVSEHNRDPNKDHNRFVYGSRAALSKLERGALKSKRRWRAQMGVPQQIPEDRLVTLREWAAKDPIPFEDDGHWAEKIMEHYSSTPELVFEFTLLWRNHFVKYAKPKYLPDYWVVDRPLDVRDNM